MRISRLGLTRTSAHIIIIIVIISMDTEYQLAEETQSSAKDDRGSDKSSIVLQATWAWFRYHLYYNLDYNTSLALLDCFLNQARAAEGRARLVSWNCFGSRVGMCVYVCPPPRPLITSGVIWCDIGRVPLVKQVLRLFPAFNYFVRHLPSIKWMGVAI